MYTLTVKIRIKEKNETTLPSLLYWKHLRNLESTDLNLLGKKCIAW